MVAAYILNKRKGTTSNFRVGLGWELATLHHRTLHKALDLDGFFGTTYTTEIEILSLI
jgi:hypothetical protein